MDNLQLMHAQLTEIYNLQCSAGLNKEYYGKRLSKVQRLNTWMEVVIAAGTAGSGVSGVSAIADLGILYIKFIWAALAGISALLAVLKPILQFNKQTERLSKLFSGYSEVYTTISLIVSTVKFSRDITEENVAAFRAVQKRFIELSSDDDPNPDRKLSAKCEALIRSRHSPQDAWYPS